MKHIINIAILLLINCLGYSQSFVGSAPRVVSTGEQFRLTYTLNASGSGFIAPDLRDFSILVGPSTSSSSSIQIINGQMSQSVTYTFTYILTANKEGKFTIPPAKIKVEGKVISSNSVEIEVIKGSTPPPSQQQANQQTQQPSTTIADIGNEDLFVRIIVDENSVYQGEQIIATLKIYTRLNIVGFSNMKFPSYQGFYSQEIETPSQISLNRENVNGQIYSTGILKKMILFPQRSGELTIEPFEIECIVRQQVRRNYNNFFDDFFGFGYQDVKKTVKSKSIQINVKPLPGNKPVSFNGAVGNLKMEAKIDKTDVKTNDAITLKIKISGNGNLKLIETPKVNLPADFETFDPKTETNINNTENGVKGIKSFEYLMIPRNAGKFRIPPIEFSYFDTETKQYKTITSEQFQINVEKGAGDTQGTVITSGYSKEDIKFIGSDIRYIKTNKYSGLKERGKTIFGSLQFYLTYIISTVLFFIILFLYRKRVRENANIALVKNRRANKEARKRLKKAAVHLKSNNKELFYEEITKGLWGYLSDKMNIPLSELSKERTIESLIKHKVEEQLIKQFTACIDTCEFARYAPISEAGQMDAIYKEATDIIEKFENIL